jgi:hypothetical protein
MIFLVNDKTLCKAVIHGTDASEEIAAGYRVVTTEEWDAFKTGSQLKREKVQKPIYKQRAKKEKS